MPQLIMFVLCERAIIEAESSIFSAIAILENINVELPASTAPNVEGRAPIKWAMAMQWRMLPEDFGKKFDVRVQVVYPESVRTLDNFYDFTAEPPSPYQRLLAQTNTFPVGVPGMYEFRLSIREAGSEEEWIEQAQYVVSVNHILIEDTDAPPDPDDDWAELEPPPIEDDEDGTT